MLSIRLFNCQIYCASLFIDVVILVIVNDLYFLLHNIRYSFMMIYIFSVNDLYFLYKCYIRYSIFFMIYVLSNVCKVQDGFQNSDFLHFLGLF